MFKPLQDWIKIRENENKSLVHIPVSSDTVRGQ